MMQCDQDKPGAATFKPNSRPDENKMPDIYI